MKTYGLHSNYMQIFLYTVSIKLIFVEFIFEILLLFMYFAEIKAFF